MGNNPHVLRLNAFGSYSVEFPKRIVFRNGIDFQEPVNKFSWIEEDERIVYKQGHNYKVKRTP